MFIQRHDIAEILQRLALSTNQSIYQSLQVYPILKGKYAISAYHH